MGLGGQPKPVPSRRLEPSDTTTTPIKRPSLPSVRIKIQHRCRVTYPFLNLLRPTAPIPLPRSNAAVSAAKPCLALSGVKSWRWTRTSVATRLDICGPVFLRNIIEYKRATAETQRELR